MCDDDRHVAAAGRATPIPVERCSACTRLKPVDELDELDGELVCIDCMVSSAASIAWSGGLDNMLDDQAT